MGSTFTHPCRLGPAFKEVVLLPWECEYSGGEQGTEFGHTPNIGMAEPEAFLYALPCSLICNHQQMLEFVGQKVRKINNLWGETRKCFLDATVITRGQSWEMKKLSIFREELRLPHFMDNLHYCDPEYAEKFGLKVLGPHCVLIHLHICHNVFRLLVGPLSKLPYSMYAVYCKNNITFIREEATRAQMFEVMCSYIMETRKYSP